MPNRTTTTDRQADKAIRDIEDFIAERRKNKKSIDFSNALRYIKNITKIKQKKGNIKVMSESTTQTVPVTKKVVKKSKISKQNYAASFLAAPFIIVGVASLVQSSIPYFEYVLGAIVAGFIVYLLVKE